MSLNEAGLEKGGSSDIEQVGYFQKKERPVLIAVARVLQRAKLANIEVSDHSNQICADMPIDRGVLVRLVLRDRSGSPSEENLELARTMSTLGGSFLDRLPKIIRVTQGRQLLEKFLADYIDAEVKLKDAITDFRSVPSGVNLEKLCQATTKKVSFEDETQEPAYKKGTKDSTVPILPLTKEPRVAEVLADFIRKNPGPGMATSVREVISYSDDATLINEFVTKPILARFGPERKTIPDLLSELGRRDGLLHSLVMSAVSGNIAANGEIMDIAAHWDFLSDSLKAAGGDARQTRDKFNQMHEFIIGKIYDCAAKPNIGTEGLVRAYWKNFGRGVKERYFLLSLFPKLPSGLAVGFYSDLVDMSFGDKDRAGTLLKIYISNKPHFKVSPIRQYNQAIEEIARSAAESPDSSDQRYQTELATDAIRNLYSLSEGEGWVESINFLTNLIKSKTAPADLVDAACFRLGGNEKTKGNTQLEIGFVKAVLGTVLSSDPFAYGQVFKTRNVTYLLTELNRFLAVHTGVATTLSGSEKEEIEWGITSYYLYRGLTPSTNTQKDPVEEQIAKLLKNLNIPLEKVSL